ncbi:serine/threonine protein kinase [Paenibacillus sp. y28]|uniref:serine/threonine protein kinase n=1 Tax=Paenibacillus sp. y28 TaxID=3129110 RepID=UPI003017CE53
MAHMPIDKGDMMPVFNFPAAGLWLRRLREWRFRRGAVIHGRYRILKRLGEGSYGVTYLCEDRRHGSYCVLKRICPARGGRSRARRVFEQETRIMAKLPARQFPKLLSRFTCGQESCFTMDYVQGQSLEQLLFQEEAAFSEKHSLSLILQLLAVVEELHRLRIIHRDISISNLILSGESLALIDFGLARELSESHSEPLPGDDVWPDDPLDKQLRRRIDVTSDFYAVGHLLLFLLYSMYPDTDEEAQRSWENELTLHPGTKKLLRRLLLAEQPYASAGQIIDDIRHILRSIG